MTDRPAPAAPPRTHAPAGTMTRRAKLGVAALATVVLGLSIRTFGDGAWAGPAGDALYAVLIYLLVAILIPTTPQALVAGAAMTICALIEVLQLTGLPAQLAQSWPPVGLLLGTTFGMADLIAYAVACTGAYAIDRTLSNRH
jgi:hypothetical protein